MKILRGKQHKPPRLLIYGGGGVGKTTLASQFPSPLIVQTEDGAGQIGCDRTQVLQSWAETVDTLAEIPGEYQTIVVDSLDHLEPLIWAEVCGKQKVASIEDIGYGKGYALALDYWREFLRMLSAYDARNIVLIAHSEIKRYDDPAGEGYDRIQPKLHKGAGALVREWADAVLLATYDTATKVDKVTGKTKGIGSGDRVLCCEERPAWVAKNRYGLPLQLPLDFAELWKHLGPRSKQDELRDLLKQLTREQAQAIMDGLKLADLTEEQTTAKIHLAKEMSA
jgi:hypothetical protein